MPPCRTTLEMRDGSMPDSRATMASASSEVWRCWASKSAGTYSASITGVIGNMLRRRTEPLQVCDSVAAVAIAGFARSVSERSIGTRMDLNISRLPRPQLSLAQFDGPATRGGALVVRSLLQQLRTDKAHQPSATECHVGPVVGVEVEHRKARRRQVVGERLAPAGVAAAGQRQRQFMHAGIVPDQHQPRRGGRRRVAYDLEETRGVRAIEVRHKLDHRLRRQ